LIFAHAVFPTVFGTAFVLAYRLKGSRDALVKNSIIQDAGVQSSRQQPSARQGRSMSMKTYSGDRPLAKIPHDELIRLLVANPRNQVIVNEFMARFDEVIRRLVANAIYKRRGNAGYEATQSLIEEAVSETYCRFWQNDCQVLRSFKCRYANSIFAYLQTITHSVVSNQIRRERRQCAFGQLESLDILEEEGVGRLSGSRTSSSHSGIARNPAVESSLMEEAVRDTMRAACRDANVNRNFIIFKLHFLYGYRSREIANIKGLGLSEKGVGNTANRIRHWLRNANREVAYAK
jgi:RNA polymerase sigma factor (sigma-70 family)